MTGELTAGSPMLAENDELREPERDDGGRWGGEGGGGDVSAQVGSGHHKIHGCIDGIDGYMIFCKSSV